MREQLSTLRISRWGSTFNPELAYEKTKHIAGELNTMGVKQVLAPCIDVVRDLRWGRVEESFGEDPFLCSKDGGC